MNDRMHGAVTGGLMFLTGMIVGTGVGVLFAPASGVRTRRRLRAMAEDFGEEISDMAADARSKVDHVIERGRHLVS
jgi:gas vesicle protein